VHCFYPLSPKISTPHMRLLKGSHASFLFFGRITFINVDIVVGGPQVDAASVYNHRGKAVITASCCVKAKHPTTIAWLETTLNLGAQRLIVFIPWWYRFIECQRDRVVIADLHTIGALIAVQHPLISHT